MKKKYLIRSLILCILYSTMPIKVNAKTNVRLYPEEVLIHDEDYLLYYIEIITQNLVNLVEYNITVDYDSEILRIENQKVAVRRDEGLYPNTFGGSSGLRRSNPPQFLFGEVKYSEPLSGTGPLVGVSFKVIKPANTTVFFEINELIDDKGNEIEYEFPNNVVEFTTKETSVEPSSGIPGFSILSVFIGIIALIFFIKRSIQSLDNVKKSVREEELFLFLNVVKNLKFQV